MVIVWVVFHDISPFFVLIGGFVWRWACFKGFIIAKNIIFLFLAFSVRLWGK
ncbi:putative membrane protein [Helicobacter pylori Hp P-23]|nr:putative membrane protein [Helicobacter pylori Hp P-23]